VVKKLIAFVIAMFGSGVAIATTITVGCDDMHGFFSVTDAYGNTQSFDCTQGSTGVGSCTVSLFNLTAPPHTGVWCYASYSATFQTSGTDVGFWDYTASRTAGTCSIGASWSGQIAFTPSNGTCAEIYDYQLVHTVYAYDFVRTKGADGVTANPAIEPPGTLISGVYQYGELTSLFNGWNASTLPALIGAGFTAVLRDDSDQYFKFSGRTVTEYINDATGCGIIAQGGGSGGPNNYWSPDIANNYSVGWGQPSPGGAYSLLPDTLGEAVTGIIAIQRNYTIALPCTLPFRQRMYISGKNNSPSSTLQYEDHTNTHKIGDGWVAFQRGGSLWSPNHAAGATRRVWRYFDWAMMPQPPFFF
jgi:hypothetical protein